MEFLGHHFSPWKGRKVSVVYRLKTLPASPSMPCIPVGKAFLADLWVEASFALEQKEANFSDLTGWLQGRRSRPTMITGYLADRVWFDNNK